MHKNMPDFIAQQQQMKEDLMSSALSAKMHHKKHAGGGVGAAADGDDSIQRNALAKIFHALGFVNALAKRKLRR